MSLQDESITLTGLELFRLLRAFVDERCDDAGLQGHDDWHEVLKRSESGDLCDYLFAAKHDQLKLRASLRALLPTKVFVAAVLKEKSHPNGNQ